VPKVLVVDDQEDAARLLVTLLELDGFEAERLEGNWQRFVREVGERRPDLVILDVRLPGADGLELLRELRAHPEPETSKVPVLLVSALDHRYEGKKAGTDGFLLKPYTRKNLLEAIEEIKLEKRKS
jgi:two-component system alkaline phosphatase synthesis response regulator PhoP